MLSLPPSTRVYVATAHTDMRRGFDGLYALVRDVLALDPYSGHLFVFRNRAGNRLKFLWWDRDGLAIFYKRLEKGRFAFAVPAGATHLEMTADDLQLILQGIDPSSVKRSQRYARPPQAVP